MKIGFIVGENEQHQMELSFDQASGALLLLVDGTQVLQDSPVLSVEPTKTYELSVGDCEKHRLALQLTYGDQPVEAGIEATARLSLMVTPVSI